MHLLIITCNEKTDPDDRFLFKFDFERDSLKDQKTEAVFTILSIMQHENANFNFVFVETGSNGSKDTCEVWQSKDYLALDNLGEFFSRETWIDILYDAKLLAHDEFNNLALAEKIQSEIILITEDPFE